MKLLIHTFSSPQLVCDSNRVDATLRTSPTIDIHLLQPSIFIPQMAHIVEQTEDNKR